MNPQATITFEGNTNAFRPFESLRGSVAWQLDRSPRSLELRLFWFTRGRGTEESGIIATKVLPISRSGKEDFTFELPDRPYTFSGSLITIAWAVELVSDPDGSLGYQEFTLSPTGKELQGVKIPKPRSGAWWEKFKFTGNR